VPEGHYKVPIGKCDIVRAGEQVTIVTYGTMVYVCEAAAKKLGIDAEIIDVRTMSPLDIDPICSSVKKTGRCVVAHEATRFSGFGAELSASIQEECFWYLEAPDPACRGLGYSIPARVRMGVFSRPGSGGARAARSDGQE
jgi:2-oxoisovalerate dehydrogenase E1 component beta subunit